MRARLFSAGLRGTPADRAPAPPDARGEGRLNAGCRYPAHILDGGDTEGEIAVCGVPTRVVRSVRFARRFCGADDWVRAVRQADAATSRGAVRASPA